MDLPSNHFTHVISNFGLIGIPEPRAILSEVYRVLRPSGTAAFSIFKSVGWFDIARVAIANIPGAPAFPTWEESFTTSMKNPQPGDDQWTKPEYFEQQIRKAGFTDVKTVLHENQTRCKNAEEYLKVFTMVMNAILRNAWSQEDFERIEPHMQGAVVDELKRRFGDGEIVLKWEAYCITTKTPPSKT